MNNEAKDCDDVFRRVVDFVEDESQNYVLFELADCFIKGYDIEKLRWMLKSDDVCIVLDGLFISDEIGSKLQEVLTEIVELKSHPDEDVRAAASRITRAK